MCGLAKSFGHRALKFRNDGTFVAQIGSAGVNNYPNTVIRRISDVAVDPSGNIWIADIDAAHVIKFGPGSEVYQRTRTELEPCLGKRPIRPTNGILLSTRPATSTSVTGRMSGAADGNQRVQVFDTNGHYVSTIGQTGIAGSGNNQLRAPGHLAVYGDRLYVADTGNQRMQIFSIANPAAPSYVGTIGVTGQSGSDNAHFSNPAGVAVDANYIYVADAWNNRVQIFDRGTRNYARDHRRLLGGGQRPI